MIKFNELDPALEQEGLTLELLNGVQDVPGNLPAIINGIEKPIIPVKCSTGFWGAYDQAYIMDGKKLRVFTPTEIIIGRARYWQKNSETIIEEKIHAEMEAIKATLKKEADDLIFTFDRFYYYAFGKWRFREETKGIDSILTAIASDNRKDYSQEYIDSIKQKIETDPSMEASIANLKETLDAKDWESLYMLLKTDGLPLIMSVKKGDKDSMAALVQMFHIDKLEDTIEQMQGKSHLYMVCKARVMKQIWKAA